MTAVRRAAEPSRRARFGGLSLLPFCAALLSGGCGSPTDPDDVDVIGTWALHSVAGATVPATFAGDGGSVTITGGWLVLADDGTYRDGAAALLDIGGGAVWEVERQSGTYSVSGSTVRFSDSGDGEGPFTGTWSAGRLTITSDGLDVEFRRGAAVDALDLSPPAAGLTTCAPLRLTMGASDHLGDPVAAPSVTWSSSDGSVATVDDAGVVTPAGNGRTVILATAGSGVDSTVVDVAYGTPTAVLVEPVVWQFGNPSIAWSPASPDAFCAYAVARSGNYGGVAGVVDSIFDVAESSYRDAGVQQLFGISITYAVEVVNGPHVVVSDSVRTGLGTLLPHDVERRPLANPSRGEIYLTPGAIGDSLFVLSTATNTVTGRRGIAGGPFTVRPDGQGLVLVQHSYAYATDSLFVLDAGTLDVSHAVALPPGRQRRGPIAAGRTGRVYIADTDGQSGITWIDVVDTGTGEEIGRIDVSGTASVGEPTLLAMAPDLERLYVVKGAQVVAVDISTDVPEIDASVTMPHPLGALALAPDGERLYVGQLYVAGSGIDVLDAFGLGVEGRLPAPGLYALATSPDHLYASTGLDGRPGDLYFLSGDVIRWNHGTLTEADRRGFLMVPAWLTVSGDGSALYARGPTATTLMVPTW